MPKEEKMEETTQDLQQVEQAVSLYGKMAKEDPERKVDVPEEEGIPTLEDKWDESNLSDMQFTGSKLFPEALGDDISNKVMIGRVSPDVFISALRLMTIEDIMNSDPKKPINVVATMMKNYILLSIGLDGKGRIDLIELAGSSRESEELANLGKGLFA